MAKWQKKWQKKWEKRQKKWENSQKKWGNLSGEAESEKAPSAENDVRLS